MASSATMKMIKNVVKEVFSNIIYVIRIMFILNHYLFVWKRSSSIRSNDISNWRVRLTIGDCPGYFAVVIPD